MLKSNLVLIEGIPGSGKTTTARKVYEFLLELGFNAKLYSEGDLHPADLAWCAYLSKDEFEKLISDYPDYKEVIEMNSSIEEDSVVVAYTKLNIFNKQLNEFFSESEIYDGRIGLDRFQSINLKRWRSFADSCSKDTIYIFECAFLQNHICELMGARSKETSFIKSYLNKLISSVSELNPILIYLNQQDIEETIGRVAKERVSQDENHKDWIDLVIEWVEKSNFGIKHKLEGYQGVISFTEERKKLELEVIDTLSIEKHIIQNSDYNWDGVMLYIKEIILESFASNNMLYVNERKPKRE